MIYPSLKWLHIVAVIVWIGGMLSESVAMHACLRADADRRWAGTKVALAYMRRWDERATTPAMLVAWAAGIMLAVQGAWFGEVWLTVKLLPVVLLSALHGVLVGTLRRLIRDDARRSDDRREHVPALVIVCVGIVVGLVVFKP